MGLSQKETYGADGALSGLTFDPDKLVIVEDPAHPLYDERVHDPLEETFIRNVEFHGIIQPVSISRDPETGIVYVVAGRQRVRAAREVNRRRSERGDPPLFVPTTIQKVFDGARLAAVAVSENENRRDDNAMVKARKMAHLESLGHDADAIATHFGVNKLTVENYLALIGCSKAVHKAVESGTLGISDVRALAKLKPAEQTAKVAELTQATAGKTGHAKARAKREIVQTDGKPKMKGRKEIEAKLAELSGPLTKELVAYIEALEWVLGGTPDKPEKDTKTAPLLDETPT